MTGRQAGRRIGAAACVCAALLALAWLAARPAAAQTIFGDGFEDGTGCGWSAFVISTEPFFGADGAPWPAPWSVAGSVDVGDLSLGRGRLRPTPSNYSLARMKAPAPTRDVEVAFALTFEQQSTQGVGFYVRQNGGYLQQTNPQGQGYAVFVEGFRGFPRIGLWKEQGGVETELAFLNLATPFVDGLVYRARFRTIQQDESATHLYGKVWLASNAEPAGWQVDVADSSVVPLQGATGGIAVDSWSVLQDPPITAHTFVDEIGIALACPPP